VAFETEGEQAPIVEGMPGSRLALKGLAFRTAVGDDRPDRFMAVCITCPHAGCEVKYVDDVSRMDSRLTGGRTDPLLFCGCHQSVFDPRASGALLGGPASRGMYQFRLRVTGAALEVTDIEEDALK
jgi:Rieske Fe-S protein